MRISLIKNKDDRDSFRMFKGFGFDVVELENLEEIDDKINILINDEYDTIILTNEVASFSEDIIKKYDTNKNINIIIAPNKKGYR